MAIFFLCLSNFQYSYEIVQILFSLPIYFQFHSFLSAGRVLYLCNFPSYMSLTFLLEIIVIFWYFSYHAILILSATFISKYSFSCFSWCIHSVRITIIILIDVATIQYQEVAERRYRIYKEFVLIVKLQN